MQRTRCTVDALQPDIAYRAQVLMGGEELGSATVRTLSAPARRLDVTVFGAAGDGATLNTKALQAAIDACGGGQGRFLHIIVGSASWSCGQGTTPHLDS